MQMSKDDCFDVCDRMTCFGDGCWKFFVFSVVDLSEEVIVWRSPDCWPISTRASFEENQSFAWVLTERISGPGDVACAEVDVDC